MSSFTPVYDFCTEAERKFYNYITAEGFTVDPTNKVHKGSKCKSTHASISELFAYPSDVDVCTECMDRDTTVEYRGLWSPALSAVGRLRTIVENADSICTRLSNTAREKQVYINRAFFWSNTLVNLNSAFASWVDVLSARPNTVYIWNEVADTYARVVELLLPLCENPKMTQVYYLPNSPVRWITNPQEPFIGHTQRLFEQQAFAKNARGGFYLVESTFDQFFPNHWPFPKLTTEDTYHVSDLALYQPETLQTALAFRQDGMSIEEAFKTASALAT